MNEHPAPASRGLPGSVVWIGLLTLAAVILFVGVRALQNGTENQFAGGFPAPGLPQTGGRSPVENPSSGVDAATPTPTAAASPESAPETRETCTYGSLYWQSHPEAWPVENFVLGSLVYSKREALEIMQRQGRDARDDLLAQFFTAAMNSLSGARSAPADEALNETSSWLEENMPLAALPEPQSQAAANLAGRLEAYNLGRAGLPACPGQPQASPTPAPTLTPTATNTRRPVAPPTRTPRPQERAGGGTTPATAAPPLPTQALPTQAPPSPAPPSPAPPSTAISTSAPPPPTQPPPTAAPPPTAEPPTPEPQPTDTPAPRDPPPKPTNENKPTKKP